MNRFLPHTKAFFILFLFLHQARCTAGLQEIVIAADNPSIDAVQQEPGVSGIESFDFNWLYYAKYINQYLQDKVLEHDVEIVNIYNPNMIPLRTDNKVIIGVVHEVYRGILPALQACDYLIYVNWLQKEIIETIAGIKKPHTVLPRLPVPMHLFKKYAVADEKRDNCIYIGGHLTNTKQRQFVEKLEALVHTLNQKPETAQTLLRCYFVCRSPAAVAQLASLKQALYASPLLKNRIDGIYNATSIKYHDMLKNMAQCRYAFMWRDEPTRHQIMQYLAEKKATVLGHSIGESSMLTTALGVGCQIITEAEERYRFLPFFENKPLFTFKQYAAALATAIVRAGVRKKVERERNKTVLVERFHDEE